MFKLENNHLSAQVKALGTGLRSKLARVTSGGALIPEMDGMRFFAIFAVVIFHSRYGLRLPGGHTYFNIISDFITKRGWFGVEVFFGISGFILALPFAKHYITGSKKPSISKYYIRRVTRLEPPYLISVLVYGAFAVFVGHQSARYVIHGLTPALFYGQHLLSHGIPKFNPSWWSLEAEVQFYIFSPLLFQLFRVRHVFARRAVIWCTPLAIFLLVRPLMYRGIVPMGTVLSYLGYFFVGVLLADIYIVDWQQKPSRNWRYDLVACVAFGILLAYIRQFHGARTSDPAWGIPIRNFLICPPLSFALFLGAFRGCYINKIVRNCWLVTIGGMCYTIYLYHVVYRGLWQKYMSSYLAPPFLGILNILTLLILCSCIFLILEKPFMYRDWHIKVWKRLRIMIMKEPNPDLEVVEYES